MLTLLLLVGALQPRFTACSTELQAEFHASLDIEQANDGWRSVTIDCKTRSIVLGAAGDAMQKTWAKLDACLDAPCDAEGRVAALLTTEMLKTEPAVRVSAPVQQPVVSAPTRPQPVLRFGYEPPWVRPVRGAGIGLAISGGVLIITGATLLMLTDLRRPGRDVGFWTSIGMMSGGAASLGGGLAMIIVAQRAKMRAMFTPAVLPGGAGLMMNGSF